LTEARNDAGMTLQLASEEPEAGPWHVEPLAVLVQVITECRRVQEVSGRPLILVIDGRSNNGMTTLAGRIGSAVAGSVVIHTDEIWSGSYTGTGTVLLEPIAEVRNTYENHDDPSSTFYISETTTITNLTGKCTTPNVCG
jgi:hypothetical protein